MMMDDIKEGRSYSRTKRDAEDKELWRGAPWRTCLRQNTRWLYWTTCLGLNRLKDHLQYNIKNNMWMCKNMKFISSMSSIISHAWAKQTSEISCLKINMNNKFYSNKFQAPMYCSVYYMQIHVCLLPWSRLYEGRIVLSNWNASSVSYPCHNCNLIN